MKRRASAACCHNMYTSDLILIKVNAVNCVSMKFAAQEKEAPFFSQRACRVTASTSTYKEKHRPYTHIQIRKHGIYWPINMGEFQKRLIRSVPKHTISIKEVTDRLSRLNPQALEPKELWAHRCCLIMAMSYCIESATISSHHWDHADLCAINFMAVVYCICILLFVACNHSVSELFGSIGNNSVLLLLGVRSSNNPNIFSPKS